MGGGGVRGSGGRGSKAETEGHTETETVYACGSVLSLLS